MNEIANSIEQMRNQDYILKEYYQLKEIIVILQEKFLKEVYLRIKSQYLQATQKELQLTFDEVNVLVRMEKIKFDKFAEFIQLIIRMIDQNKFEAVWAEKLNKIMTQKKNETGEVE